MAGVWDFLFREHKKISDEKGAKRVVVLDSSGNQIDQFSVDDQYPAGSGSNGSVTLTNADTAYAVPSSAPTKKYVIVLYNDSGSDIYWGFENSNSNGIILEDGERVAVDLGANKQLYCYSSSAGVAIKYSLIEIE